MKNINKILYVLIAVVAFSFSTSCEIGDDDFSAPNYITFANKVENIGVEIGGSTSYDVKVFTANTTGADRTYPVEVASSSTLDAGAYTVPGSVTIPGNSNEGIITIQISDVNIGDTGETLVLNLIDNGDYSTGASATLNVTQVCPTGDFFINFTFDGYGSETTWEVKDANGDVVASGGGYEDGQESASSKLCLDSGDYTFTVFDSYGDGLSYPANGSVTLVYNGAAVGSIEGDFGTEASIDFTIN